MATQPPHQVAPFGTATPALGAQLLVPPSARDLRTQSVQRLQVGLFGLAAMLLLVGLANIIMDRARLAEAASGVVVSSPAASASASPQSDPLADIGVVPAASPSEAAPTQSVVPLPQGPATN
jgi:hypothetical protein